MILRHPLVAVFLGVVATPVAYAQTAEPEPTEPDAATPSSEPTEPDAPAPPSEPTQSDAPTSPSEPAEPEPPASPSEAASEPPATPSADDEAERKGDVVDVGEPDELGTVVVTAERPAIALSDVPGATHIIDGDAVANKRALTTADVLAFTPGVFATASGANDGIKIGIRGSGISNNQQYRTGVDFLFDGLSMPGLAQATPPALFEPYGLEYTEVLIGSNAFDYGSLALGGAINFVSKTGYTAEPFKIRFDGGSYGYVKAQASSGAVVGHADYYLSATASRADGYQTHTSSRNFRLLGNFGYKFSDKVTNRVYYRLGQVYFQAPGNLTLAQLLENPRQGNPTTIAADAYWQNDLNFWVGDKLTFQIDPDNELVVGGTANHAPLWINNRGVEGGTAGYYTETNVTGTVQYSRKGKLFTRDNVTRAGFRLNYVIDSSAHAKDLSVTTSPTYGQDVTQSRQDGTNNQVLSLSNDLNVIHRLWLRTGISGIRTQTRNHLVIARGTIDNTNDDYEQWDFNYVVGLRYDIKPDFQVFANVSRSVEPVVAANNRHPSTNFLTRIVHQTGTTIEVGTRGRVSIFEGSLSVYRTDLLNELLSVEIDPGPPAVRQTTNGSPTVHQGIEAGLNIRLLEPAKDHLLALRQTYTYNEFFFKNDADFANNKLPGLPPHYYQAELAYNHPSGFNAGVNVRYVSDYFVDYGNSLSAPAYGLLGARVGFEQKNWEVHAEGSNLTNQYFATSARTQYNLGGADFATFLPGDGIGFFGGLSFHY